MVSSRDSIFKIVDQLQLRLGSVPKREKLKAKSQHPQGKILIVSPHPDDEILLGGIAMRLAAENGMTVFNFPFSFGSNPQRQRERKNELEKACRYVNFKLLPPTAHPQNQLKNVIKTLTPQLIIAPHAHDKHPTHINTHLATVNAIKATKFNGLVAWGEFWGQLKKVNCLIEIHPQQTKKQISALTYHQGEMKRHPYHLKLPFWQIDQVRATIEFFVPKGSPVPSMCFGQNYFLQRSTNGKLSSLKNKHLLSLHDDVTRLFTS